MSTGVVPRPSLDVAAKPRSPARAGSKPASRQTAGVLIHRVYEGADAGSTVTRRPSPPFSRPAG